MKRSQCVIRAVLLLMVIQLHCETLLAAKDSAQSSTSQKKHKKDPDDVTDLDNLERYANPISSPYVISAIQKSLTPSNSHKSPVRLNEWYANLKYGTELDNSGQYADPFPLSLSASRKHKKHPDDSTDLDSLKLYTDSVPSPNVITASRHKPQAPPSKSHRYQAHLDDAADLDSLKLYADSAPSPYIVSISNHKPQTSPSKSRGRQVHLDDAADPNSLGLYANPTASPYIITVPNRKTQTQSRKSHSHQVYLDDAADLSLGLGLYADPIQLPYIITVPTRKPHTSPSDSHGVYSDAANLNHFRQSADPHMFAVPTRRPQSKRKISSNDVPEEYSDASNEYLHDVAEEYLHDRYLDAIHSSTYDFDSAQPTRRMNPLHRLVDIGIKGMSEIPRILLDDYDEKGKRSRYEEVETVIKCPQETELVGNHCKDIFDPFDDKATEIRKKVVTKSDVYMDDYY